MWPFRRRPARPSPDAEAAVEQASRALRDAKALDVRFEEAARRADEIKRVNHIALAVARSIRGAS